MKVKCVENKYTNLTVGKNYEVRSVDGDWIEVVNDIGYSKEYHKNLFDVIS